VPLNPLGPQFRSMVCEHGVVCMLLNLFEPKFKWFRATDESEVV